MRIEKIEKIKFKKNMFKVFFENSESLAIFADSIVKFGIRTGINISENDYKQLASYDKLKRATSDALVLVSKRSYSAKSLCAKLIQKGYDSENAIKAVRKLKELNYINDKKFAKICADYLSQKGKGEFAIRAELEEQGIEESLINEALEIIKTNIEPYEQIIKILKTKFEKFSGKDKNEARRIASFLLRRGFSYQDITKAFRARSL
ncbi:regulatory protein RecX [Candidatus Endomicrobiellum agilis]|uniref:regulatory protein RecX n=1 Tax=Candidatus Endomicrobiellum agilis TaxID=3238957 RepID=UPI0035A99E2B